MAMRRRPPPSPLPQKNPVKKQCGAVIVARLRRVECHGKLDRAVALPLQGDFMSASYTLSVVVSFPIARVKAEAVLERYWAHRKARKLYMRERRRLKPADKANGGAPT